ncbi:MAG TPA: hypothetical protein DD435_03105 [Cyanobacteria bacterium UBA8530]|nr:hypothetical protein [Cyanobacteria bacterium UBA8530]
MNRQFFWILLFVVACGRAEGSPRSPQPPLPTMPPRDVYLSEWDHLSPGTEPSEFVDESLHYAYPWLYAGEWAITRSGFAVTEAMTDQEEPLTFRRYRGDAFSPGGLLPLHYRVEAKGRSLGGARRFSGFGELAIQVYYLDPTHYLEVLQTNDHLCLWLADGAQPGSGNGWRLLVRLDNPTPVGDWVCLGAEVDIPKNQVTVLLDGFPLGTVKLAFLRPRPHGLTLRATGNREEWAWLSIRNLY